MTDFGIAIFDLLFIAVLIVAFVAGFIQGVVRRLLGIAAAIVAFLLASNLREPLGDALASSWPQYPPGYTTMLAFGGLFIVLFIGASLVIQGFYHRTPISQDDEWLDEVIGGVLGIVEALLLMGIGALILDSYFGTTGVLYAPNEFLILRTIYDDMALSVDGQVHHRHADPRLRRPVGPAHPRRPPHHVPPLSAPPPGAADATGLRTFPREALLADPPAAARSLLGALLVRAADGGRADRPDRGGRGVRGPGGPRVARTIREDLTGRRRCSARRATRTSIVSTACISASTS